MSPYDFMRQGIALETCKKRQKLDVKYVLGLGPIMYVSIKDSTWWGSLGMVNFCLQ